MIFKNKNREKARKLIAMVNTVAISSLTPFLNRFSNLEQIIRARGTDDWDFFMTVAGVGIALQTIGSKPPEKDFHQFAIGLQEHFPKWDHNAAAAFDNLTKFTQKNVSGGVDPITATGLWVLWNVKQDSPTDDEISLAPVIGRFLAENLKGWWDQL